MLKQVYAPEGLSIYVRTNGTCLNEVLRVSRNYRGKLVFKEYFYRSTGRGPWENKDHKLWCHLSPDMLVEWNSDEESA